MPISEIVNDSDWPQPLVDLMLQNERKDDGRLHVTSLNACLRQTILKFRHPYQVYTSKLYPMARGIVFHEGMATTLKKLAQPHLVIEQNVRREVDGVIVSGTCDMIDTKAHAIIDWKLPLRAASKIWPAYIAQLNVYAWLAAAEYRVDRILLGPWDPYGLRMKEIERWPAHKVEDYVKDRVEVYKTQPIPPPEALGWEPFHCKNCPVRSLCEAQEDFIDYV